MFISLTSQIACMFVYICLANKADSEIHCALNVTVKKNVLCILHPHLIYYINTQPMRAETLSDQSGSVSGALRVMLMSSRGQHDTGISPELSGHILCVSFI